MRWVTLPAIHCYAPYCGRERHAVEEKVADGAFEEDGDREGEEEVVDEDEEEELFVVRFVVTVVDAGIGTRPDVIPSSITRKRP